MKVSSFYKMIIPVVKCRVVEARVFIRATLSFAMAVIIISSMVFLVKSSHGLFSGKAEASFKPVVLGMSALEKELYAQDLKTLLGNNPEKLSQLVGLDILLVLDQPSFKRKDGSFQMWQYNNDYCVLDIYMDMAVARDSDYARIVHYEMREHSKALLMPEAGHEGDKVSDRDCLMVLLD